MLHTIENEQIRVTISDHGAELVSVYDKGHDYERIWCANPAIWNRHAPVLFPFVGKVKGGAYRYQGHTYAMTTQHGFARDAEFTCIEKTADSITHSLKASDATYTIYPFPFELQITHRLNPTQPRELLVQWNVINHGDTEMLYCIGGHPGFQIAPDTKRSDYYLVLPDAAPKQYLLLDADGSGLCDTSHMYTLASDSAYVPICDTFFDKDALIFENNQLKTIGIADKNKQPFLSLFCEDFPYVGIWSKPDGPYICLEPWLGRTDDMTFEGDLSDKPGIVHLDAAASKTHSYTMHFH